MIALRPTVIAVILALTTSVQVTPQKKDLSVQGSDREIIKTVSTAPYDIVEVKGSMEVYIEKGPEGTIQITAEEKVQEYIIVESDGKTLYISLKPHNSLGNYGKIRIKVPFQNLSGLSLNGSGKIEGKDIIESDILNIELNGSGNIKVGVKTSSLISKVIGSGSIETEGSTTNLNADTNGSGNFSGRTLRTQDAAITITGSGNSTVNVNKNLSGKIIGSGAVTYLGNPSSNQVKISGSGKVKAE